MVFEFVNKVPLPRTKKKAIASVVELFVIDCLSKFELISLLALMIEHMCKVIHDKEGKYSMPYGYLLKRVFAHFGIIGENVPP